jgi:acetylornithine deacetylase/succinyl-diaminopimelate desuccinylase-like protein
MQLCAYDLLRPHGIEPHLLPSRSEAPSQVNLLCSVRGRDHDRPPLVLNTHLDTVPPGDAAKWTECPLGPFAAEFKGDRVYGLGAADTKLDFVAKALALIEAGTPRRDIYLVATFGEEHGLVGAKELVSAAVLPKGALAFVGEPSGLQVITAHKGLMVFELEIQFEPEKPAVRTFPTYRVIFEGRAVHSSTPALGINAIQLALQMLGQNPNLHPLNIAGGDAINKVPAWCEVLIAGEPMSALPPLSRIESAAINASEFIPRQVFSVLSTLVNRLNDLSTRFDKPEPGYASPTLTFNLGLIRSSSNSVAVEFELRPPPSLSLEEVRRAVDEISEALLHLHQPIRVWERRANPGFRSPPASETVELAMAALAEVNLPLASGVKSGCTEAGVYSSAGMIPVVFGPGPSTGVIHAPNEYNLLSEVDAAIRFYRALLEL